MGTGWHIRLLGREGLGGLTMKLPWGNALLHLLPKLSIASASTFSFTNENNKLSCGDTCNVFIAVKEFR